MTEKEEVEEFFDLLGATEKQEKQEAPERKLKPEPVADPKLTKKIL